MPVAAPQRECLAAYPDQTILKTGIRAGVLWRRGGQSNQSVALPLFGQIAAGDDDHENLVRIPDQEIANRVGAFDYEGAVLRPYSFIKEKVTNMRPLRARQESK